MNPEPLPHIPNLTVRTGQPENNQAHFPRVGGALDNPLYNYTVNYSRPEKNVNIDKAKEQQEKREQEDQEDVYVYQEPCELRNDLKEVLERQKEEDDQCYDHLNYTRTVNELSPNYFKFNNTK